MPDVFGSSSLTTEAGVTTTISVNATEFAVSNGREAKCLFTYSTIDLVIPYTATARFLFDAKGATSWTTSFAAQYQAASYTRISTVVTFVDAASGRAGESLYCTGQLMLLKLPSPSTLAAPADQLLFSLLQSALCASQPTPPPRQPMAAAS